MDKISRDRAPEPKKILRAKPVEGEVDHAALSREHMARYPKIRASLARAEARCKANDTAKSADLTDEIIARFPTIIKTLGES